MIDDPLYIAVDLGAGSGRVFLSDLANGKFKLEEVRRFSYPATQSLGNLRWDFPTIFGEIKAGLKNASLRASELGRRILSVGVDSWAVDYGLVGTYGKLVADPVSYRDSRTDEAMTRVFAIVPREEVFEKTGIRGRYEPQEYARYL